MKFERAVRRLFRPSLLLHCPSCTLFLSLFGVRLARHSPSYSTVVSSASVSPSLFYSCFPLYRSRGRSGDRRLSCWTKGRGVKGGKARNVATLHDRATSNSVDVYRQRSSDSAPGSSAVAADGTGALRFASTT